MSFLVFQNLLKLSCGPNNPVIHRGFKFYIAGIIPGGGLTKIQGIKEEEYFSRLDHKLFQNLKDRSESEEDFRCFDYKHTLGVNPVLRAFDYVCSVKHKNCPEEAYFLSDHYDCLQLLKMKAKKPNDQEKV